MRYDAFVRVLLVVLLFPGVLQAQEATVTAAAPIYLLPDSARIPLRTAAVNTRLRVLEEAPEGWVKVEFRDPRFGNRVGYIEARFIRLHRPELEPMDLSVTREPGDFVAPPGASPRPPPPAAPPVRPSYQPRGFARGWIDVNVGVAVAADSRYGSVFERLSFGEPARFTADYHSPAGAAVDIGAGVMFTPMFGLGINFTGTAHQDNADLGISIPHPIWPDTYASDGAPTEGKLARSEGGAHIQAMFVSRISDRVDARVFGGPSYFRLQQDAVSNIVYAHDFILLLPVHEVDIRRYDTERIEFDDGGGWGFHVGADLNVFFSRVVGLGLFAKYMRGTVEVFDPLSRADRTFTTGGFQTGGGLRLRF